MRLGIERFERYGSQVARQVGRVRQCVVAVPAYRLPVEGRAIRTDRAEHPLLQRGVVTEGLVLRLVMEPIMNRVSRRDRLGAAKLLDSEAAEIGDLVVLNNGNRGARYARTV